MENRPQRRGEIAESFEAAELILRQRLRREEVERDRLLVEEEPLEDREVVGERFPRCRAGGHGDMFAGARVLDRPRLVDVEALDLLGLQQALKRLGERFAQVPVNRLPLGEVLQVREFVHLAEPVDILPALVKRSTVHIAARGKAGQPFFLYVPLNSPHTPIVPSKEWQGKSGLGDYGDFVMETDWAVGEVLAAIDKAGIGDNTLVIFTSDNGCSKAAGINALEKQGHYPSADLRGSKADIWEGGHRMPYFVRWPGKVKAGSRSGQIICHTDLMATCAELVGAKLPDNAGEDSVSILPALLGTDKAPLREAIVHHSINGSFSIRQGNMKLELCADSGEWTAPTPGSKESKSLPPTQLYDLGTDLAESKNLQAERPEEVARLSKLLDQYIANGRSTPGAKQANDAHIELRKRGKTAKEE